MDISTGPTTNSAIPATPTVDPAGDIPAGGPGLDTGTAQQPRFRLVRSRTDRMLGGVCGGLGKTLGVDPAMLRIGLVVLTVLAAGAGVVVYLAAWMLAPEED